MRERGVHGHGPPRPSPGQSRRHWTLAQGTGVTHRCCHYRLLIPPRQNIAANYNSQLRKAERGAVAQGYNL